MDGYPPAECNAWHGDDQNINLAGKSAPTSKHPPSFAGRRFAFHTSKADVVLMRRLSLLVDRSTHQRKTQAHPRARSHSAEQFHFTRAQV